MAVTAGQRALEQAGFMVMDVWQGKWFEVITPRGGQEAVVLRQSPHRWHVFYCHDATSSGHDPRHALDGGLGDVIDTEAQLRSYLNMVRRAPKQLRERYYGLYAAREMI